MIKIMSNEADFIKDVKNENGTVVVYGAGRDGILFSSIGAVKINYFCDKIEFDEKKVNGIEVIQINKIRELTSPIQMLICVRLLDEQYNNIVISELIPKLESMNVSIRVYNAAINLKYEGIINGKNPLVLNIGEFYRKIPWYFEKVYEKTREDLVNYVVDIFPNIKLIAKGNVITLADYTSEKFNIIDGIRKTIYSDDIKYLNSIHVYGDSRVVGTGIEDKETFESLLQNRIDNKGRSYKKYRVINHGVISSRIMEMVQQFENTMLEKGDVVFFMNHCYYVDEIERHLFWHYLEDVRNKCLKNNVEFYFINIPYILELSNKSYIMNEIINLFRYNLSYFTKEKLLEYKQEAHLACSKNNIPFFDITQDFDESNCENLFLDYLHYGPEGHNIIAKKLFKIVNFNDSFDKIEVKDILKLKSSKEQLYKESILRLSYEKELNKYINNLKNEFENYPDNAGAIVMNCNPFTNGHKYLIEKALSQVKHLYVFVVEENRSEYSFEERFNMIKQGTKHLENITILRSGSFIISSITFPEYFVKESFDKDISNIDISVDILIFSKEIAPALKINKRFVGNEPFCKITNEYNKQMRQILPNNGIEFIQVNRLEDDDEVISASRVRKLVKDKEYEKIKQIVPKYTYEVIQKKYCK